MNKLFLLLLLLPLVSASMQIDLTPLNLTNSTIEGGQLYGIYFVNGTYYLQPTNITNITYTNVTNFYNVTNITYINNTYINYTGNFSFYNFTNITYANSTINSSNVYLKSEIDSKFGNIYLKSEVDSLVSQQTINNVTNLSGQLDDIRAKIDAKNSNLWLWIVAIFALLIAIIAVLIATGMGGGG